MDWLRHLSLIRGPLPWVVGLPALGSLVLAMGWRDHRWRYRTIPVLVLLVAAIIGVGALELPHWLDSTFPGSFYLWGALPVFALGLAVAGWRSGRLSQRLASLIAIPLLLAFSASLINAQYDYIPTAADLIGAPMRDQVATLRMSSWAGGQAHGLPAVSSHRVSATWQHGEVAVVDIPSTVSRFEHRQAVVWLPPAVHDVPRPRLPVIVMLAGTPGGPDNLIRAGMVDQIADAYAAGHQGRAPILVFPDHNGTFLGDTECVDGPLGRAETYLTVDVPNYITSHFATLAAPQHWAIAGYSEGGTCALTLSLRHPNLFATFVDISGDSRAQIGHGPFTRQRTVSTLYGGDARQWKAHDARVLLSEHRNPALAGFFAAGLADRHALGVALRLHKSATTARIETHLLTGSGGHTFAFVHWALAQSFPWVAARVGSEPSNHPGVTRSG